jgi:hypothetical protein
VAGERELEGAAEADPVDRGGERLAAGLEPTVEQRQLARLLEEDAHRLLFALLALELLVEAAEALQHGEVGATGKSLLAGGDHAALDGLVRRDRLDDLRQLVDDLEIDHVHRASRAVPGCRGDAVGVGLEPEIGEIHRGLLTRAIAVQAKGSPALLV